MSRISIVGDVIVSLAPGATETARSLTEQTSMRVSSVFVSLSRESSPARHDCSESTVDEAGSSSGVLCAGAPRQALVPNATRIASDAEDEKEGKGFMVTSYVRTPTTFPTC